MNRPTHLLALAAALCIASVAQAAPPPAARCADVEMPTHGGDTAAIAADLEKVSPLTAALGQPARLAQLLAEGHDPNRCVYSTSLLSMAATMGQVASVKALLASGAAVERPLDADGQSALLHALASRQYEVAELLLSRGANPRRTTAMGRTAMHSLAIGLPSTAPASAPSPDADLAQVRMARRLLASGVRADSADRLGRTPLQAAAALGRTALVRLLLEQGANPATKNKRGDSALSIAERKGNPEMLALLKSRVR